MIENIIAMPGPAFFDLGALRNAGSSFGWTVGVSDNLSDVCFAQPYWRTSALLFHCSAFDCSWLDATRLLKSALPEVHLVACYGFSESINWPELSRAGAFHSLWLPLKEEEVGQSFGFVWEAEKRRAALVPARKLGTAKRISADSARGTEVIASAAS